jgi:hypothetical protein
MRQRWFDDPNAPGCTVQASQLDWKGLTNGSNRQDRWEVQVDRRGAAAPTLAAEAKRLGLPTEQDAYRHIRIIRRTTHPTQGLVVNRYFHHTGDGIIVALDIERFDGPQWSEIALAKYKRDFPIDTLRYVLFQNVINANTKNFICDVLYKQKSDLNFNDRNNTSAKIPLAWSFGTAEYQGILGTTFGKSVSALVLAAFPRGTHRIARVITWKNVILQVQFEIEKTADHLRAQESLHL